MRARRLVCGLGLGISLGLATGCEKLLSIQDPAASDAALERPDAAPTDDAAPMPDGPIMLPAGSPMLLSEVALSPTGGEFIEIVNTSNDTVDLSTYYLSDSAMYYRLPVAPSVEQADFIAKFPDGTMVLRHEVVTVAISADATFMGIYNKLPDFSIAGGTMKVISAPGTTTLTDTGEPIILFQWDGHSDLVRDVDIMIVGAPATNNQLTDKSSTAQDGPDAGSDTTAYAVDARTMLPQANAPGNGVSTKRIALESVGNELARGGNGPDGQDETSEDTSLTWDGTAQAPFTPPTPGQMNFALPP